MTELIYKIIKPEEWEEAEKAGIYYGSEHDNRDGFLHFSTAAQLPETLRLHYWGAWAVVIVAVRAASLGSALKYEHSATRNDDFPHLYAPLDIVIEPAEGATVVAAFVNVPSTEQDFLQHWLEELTAKHKNPL
ncbi:MAG TPA: DUF952 domain-containing protein [Rhizomicrobium sp.]|jgi:uncharacterized protein (DUF952 family)|nr:DUF952 domain-containing protein [Rhizomicrobium sp.]